jgi:membrane-bound lytic murein transglycosylase C
MRIVLLIICALFTFSSTHASDFDSFLESMNNDYKQQTTEFETYKEEIEREFAEYQKIVNEEYASYRKEIAKYWKDPEMSDQRKWVEYTDDYKEKKSIDFEDGTYKLEIIADDPKEAQEKLDNMLKDMLTIDKATAFERDVPAKNIEERTKEDLKNIVTAEVSKESVIGSVVTGKDNPTQEDIDEAAKKLKTDATVTKEEAKNGQTVFVLQGKLPSDTNLKKAEQLEPFVQKYAQEFKITPSLVYSVIQTESAFNPMAQSHVPAYGLMQIVPTSAGKDVSQMLTGKAVILTPSYLFDSENNVRAGTAYLHILYYRYLKAINHPENRLYCAIAAYNTGAGNVAVAFNGRESKNKFNINIAAGIINSMTPEQVYEHLKNKLEYAEARGYIVKVNNTIPSYINFDQR